MKILQVGEAAPQFTGIIQSGKSVSLSDYTGKKLVLYFYPKDDTPGCTAQACNLRDNYKHFIQKGFDILGISPDSVQKHIRFKEKFQLPFNLLADEGHEIAGQYGVWVEKNRYGRKYMGIARTTFIIDESGMITAIITKVNTQEHSGQIL